MDLIWYYNGLDQVMLTESMDQYFFNGSVFNWILLIHKPIEIVDTRFQFSIHICFEYCVFLFQERHQRMWSYLIRLSDKASHLGFFIWFYWKFTWESVFSKRGMGGCDPISPYIFMISVEYLSKYIYFLSTQK